MGAHVVAGDVDVDDVEFFGAEGAADGAVEFAFGAGGGRGAAADEVADSFVVPLGDDVEAAIADLAHGAVAFVVQHEHDGVESEADGGGEFVAGHLECAVADEDEGAERGVGHGDADGGGNSEAHGEVISRRDEFGAAGGADAERAEERVADVGDDAAVFVEVEGDDAHDFVHREFIGEFGLSEGFGIDVGVGVFEFFGFDFRGGEGAEIVVELDAVVAVVADVDGFGGGQDGAASVELGGVDSHGHVGDEGAEHEDAIGGFDVLADGRVAGHCAAVDAEVEGMIFGDGAFAEEVGGDGDVGALGELECEIGDAEAVELDAGEEDGFFGCVDHLQRFIEGGGEGIGIRRVRRRGVDIGNVDDFIDGIERDFDVDGAFVFQAGIDTADDFLGGAVRVEENCRGDSDFVVDAALGVEGFDLVVDEGILFRGLCGRVRR